MDKVVGGLAFVLASAVVARAQTPLRLETVAAGLNQPVWAGAPPGDDRIFVAEQATGLVRVVQDGVVLPTPFLDLSGKIEAFSHSGLLAVAFHPQYASNGRFFVYYTGPDPDDDWGPNQVRVKLESYTVSSTDPNVADPASAVEIFDLLHANPIHKGAGPVFGPDGYLYVFIGEGGLSGPLAVDDCAAGRPDNWYGKVLRLDVDSAVPYAIPPDNPFVGTPGAAPEVYHLGLRNPWRASIDPATGDLYIGDVGGADFEVVHFAPAGVGGLNFGFPVMEASACNDVICAGVLPPCGDPSYTPPIYAYPNTGNAITGGHVYRGSAIPGIGGLYFFTDYVSNQIRSFRYDEAQGLTELRDRTDELDPNGAVFQVGSMGVDGQGEILFVMRGGGGVVLRMVAATVSTYCTAKTVDHGSVQCTPQITGFSGIASFSLFGALNIDAIRVPNSKNGVFFLGTNGADAIPFQGGTLCVVPPLLRTNAMQSGGSPPPVADCTGGFSFDFNDWAQSSGHPALVPGVQINGQFWFRVPTDPFGIGLTDAIQFTVGP